tara:strand:- start:65 stop:664 length:600 start_codon:yes stop_codon:yes gene_type:complete
MVNNFLFFIFVSYLIGSIPFAYILTKIFGYGDIRSIGSGNVGATNVLRTGKKSLAFSVLLLDILKGCIPIIFIKVFYENQFQHPEIIMVASFVIIGHIFPIWLRFRGGKGVATYIGFILGINYILGIIFIFCWLSIAIIKRYSSLASILSLIIIPLISFILSYGMQTNIILSLLSIIIIFKHISNIKRLLSNSETKIKL